MIFPELATKRLKLTRITLDDARSVFELFSNPQVVAFYDLEIFNTHDQATKLIELFQTRFESFAGIRWAIRRGDSGELIGTCGFNTWNGKMRNAVIGYDLKPEYWNQGLATEALAATIRAAFAGVLPCGSLHRIQADTVPGNIASEKVLLKLGFKEEGLRRECGYWKGGYHDLKCFGLLKTEFQFHYY